MFYSSMPEPGSFGLCVLRFFMHRRLLVGIPMSLTGSRFFFLLYSTTSLISVHEPLIIIEKKNKKIHSQKLSIFINFQYSQIYPGCHVSVNVNNTYHQTRLVGCGNC